MVREELAKHSRSSLDSQDTFIGSLNTYHVNTNEFNIVKQPKANVNDVNIIPPPESER